MKGDFKLELILDATDGKPAVLAAVTRAHALAVVIEAPGVRIAAAILRRTPQACVLAGGAVTAIAIADARWQHGKAEFVRAVTIIVPAALGLELLSGDIRTADGHEQSFPFRFTGQMPTCGTDSADRYPRIALYTVTATLTAIAKHPSSVIANAPLPSLRTLLFRHCERSAAIPFDSKHLCKRSYYETGRFIALVKLSSMWIYDTW